MKHIKWLSVLLTMCMVFGLMPVTVLADGETFTVWADSNRPECLSWNRKTASEGDIVRFTVDTPYAYNIIVEDYSQNSYMVEYYEGEYYFVMPATDVELYVKCYNVAAYESDFVSLFGGATLANPGDTISVFVNPADGYTLKSLYYDLGFDRIEITQQKNEYTYTFVMPAFEADGDAVMVGAEFEYVSPKATVSYIDENGTEQSVEATLLTGHETSVYNNYGQEIHIGKAGEETWYAVQGNVVYDPSEYQRFKPNLIADGTVNLILCDGASLSGAGNLSNSRFNVFGQEAGTGTASVNQINNCDLYIYDGNLTTCITDNLNTVKLDGGSLTVTTEGFDDPMQAGGSIQCTNLTMNGGDLTAETLAVLEDITFNGGSMTLSNIEAIGSITMNGGNLNVSDHINSNGNVSLGWTDATDSVTIGYLDCPALLTKDFTNGNDVFESGNTIMGPGWQLTPVNRYTVSGSSVTGGSIDLGDVEYAFEGQDVFFDAVPDNGYVLDNLTVKQGDTSVSVSPVSGSTFMFTMPAGDVTVNATFVPKGSKPSFAGYSVLLSGQIGVNFYMNLSMLTDAERESATMEFTVNGKSTTDTFDAGCTDPKTNKYYGFTCYINSVQMADTITAVLHYTQNGEDKTITKTYSAVTYMNSVLAHSDDYSPNTVALVEAMFDYGHYVQPFLADHNNWTVGVDYAETWKWNDIDFTDSDVAAAKAAVAGYAISRDTGDSQIEAVTYSLNLESETAIRIYLRVKEGYIGPVTATLGGNSIECVKQQDGRYRIEIAGISADELGDTYNVTVSAGGKFTISVSALSYVDTALNSDSAVFNNDIAHFAVTALYRYYIATVNYKNNPNG